MLLLLLSLLATLLHGAMVFILAPLLAGVVVKCRARLLMRRGAPFMQPYLDLAKLLRKTPLIPDTATQAYQIWPFIAFAATATAALLVPGFCLGMATAPLSDFIVLIGLFAMARGAEMLAGLETGSGFGGAAAARAAMFGIFAEAALLVTVLIFALITQSLTIDGVGCVFRQGHIGISVSLGFALASMLALALTQTGRLPADNPAGHSELGMVHEAMLLEYSGRYLALFRYTAMLRLMIWFCLIGTIFFPFGLAVSSSLLTWPGGLVLWLFKLAVFAAALSFFEVSTAKIRLFRVPEFLGVAILLGLLSAVLLFAAAGIGT